MATINEIMNKSIEEYLSNERFITIAPKKIRNDLVIQGKTKYAPYKYKRPEPLNLHTPWYKCGCYTSDSIDARCCGLCYTCCPRKTVHEQCNCCPNDFTTYWDSGYVQTTSGYGKRADMEEKNGVCCWFCFPVKFSMFFPCCFGSLCNGCINYMRDTNVNYLF